MDKQISNTWFKTIKNSDGSLDTFGWSVGDSINVSVFKLAFVLIVGTLVSFLTSFFTLLIVPLSTKGQRYTNYVLSTIVIFYTCLDYRLGWLGWNGWHNFPEIYSSFISFNLASIVIIVFLMLFENQFISTLRSTKFPIIAYYVVMILSMFLLYKGIDSQLPNIIEMHVAPLVEATPSSPWG